ncbi:MAG TPA: Gfo/Idh/MocA family oxidoreductase [Chthoniobacterales bacterium]|nr:Gfo/Idh/MocA family oxidoreductase [Chthoniobacterales bacterium]
MRVGIVGAGTMGEVHAAAWCSIGAKLVGCTSSHPAQREALAQRYDIRPFADYNEFLDAVDIVDICVPTSLHRSMVLEAAAAGKDVICEKPIALTLNDAVAMIKGCDQAGVRLFIGMVLRFFPQYRLAKELVANGQLGQLGVIRLKRASYPPQPSSLQGNWYIDESRSGGMIIDLMIHDFDYARWLSGEVARVYALKGQSSNGPAQYAQAILRFRNGAMALIEGGWANPPGVFRTAIDISGSAGLIEWDSDQTPTVRTFFPPIARETAGVGLPVSGLTEDPYTAELRHAYQAIQSGTRFEVTAEDALQSLRIALSVKESIASGQPVTL